MSEKQGIKQLKKELTRLRGIIVDIDQCRRPYDQEHRVVCVPVSSMMELVQEARQILLQGKVYDGQFDEKDLALLTAEEEDDE